jgi:nitrate/TMAO reductase-like tetraheme cytochrome c subunit
MEYPMRILITALIFATATASGARAETFPVIKNQTVLTECGDCHMAFPPETLPEAVWQKMMADLSNHFGEDASLEPAPVAEILAYYSKNSSDVSNVRAARKWRAAGSFARIIDAPRFKDKHGGCTDEVWSHEKVTSKANCLACHPTMQKDGSTDENLSFLSSKLQRQCGEDDD